MSAGHSFYDFHGLVGMQIIDHERGGSSAQASLGDPFSYFRVDTLPGAPDLTLELGKFEAQNEDCYLVDHKYHVRRNYLYCEDGYQGFRWQVEIEGFENGPTHIRLDLRGGGLRQALLPGMFSKMLLTRQLLSQKFREKGWALAHAAGAARDGRAVVLHGRGGAFKTSVLMSLLRMSPAWRALGDDGVLLKGNQVLSFPTYPALFGYRLAHKDNEHLTTIDRLRVALMSLTDDAGPERYAPGAEIAALVEMQAGGVGELTIEEIPLFDNLKAMGYGMRLEQHNSVNMGFNDAYPQYREAYAYVYPMNGLTAAEETVTTCAGKASCRVHLPASPTMDDLETVCVWLNKIVSE